MSRHNTKRKRLERATPGYPPGGALLYLSPGQLQGVLGQTFYGTQTKHVATGQTALFSPGAPLPPQPNVDPGGMPVQFRFPVVYNSFPVDRTLGSPDIPSFEVLRRLATTYDGATLCLRKWLDFVPKMRLKITLKPEVLAAGGDEKDYQQEITYFRNFFDRPDGEHDTHTWLKLLLTEQVQIDELYLYKHRTRGNRMLGYQVVAGDQMKPLLDDWGRTPLATGSRGAQPYAYQQYPWGIPGMQYSTQQMFHFRESPRASTPYGFSRIEAVILRVNQALRKERKDLSYFTEGNIPQAFMEVPEASSWSQDQIDAYEQAWNSLLAGNAQQQVRIKFMQPGMKYIAAEDYQLLTDFDKYLLAICANMHGLSLASLGIVEDVNRNTAEVQDDMEYRRTVEPLALTYGAILTGFMATDFPPELHGDLLEATFAGFEEEEDVAELSTAYNTLVAGGILGVSNAAKLMKLPEEPGAKHIGRILITKDGVTFLDDEELMQAQRQAQMAGFQMASNPPPPAEPGQADGQQPPPPRNTNAPPAAQGKQQQPANTNAKPQGKQAQSRAIEGLLRRIEAWLVEERQDEDAEDDETAAQVARGGHERAADAPGATSGGAPGGYPAPAVLARAGAGGTDASGTPAPDGAARADYRRWRTRAIEDVKAGRQQRGFSTTLIPEATHRWIRDELVECSTPEAVRAVFARAQGVPESELIGGDARLEYDAKRDIWEPADTEAQLARYGAAGYDTLTWRTHVSMSGACGVCAPNDGVSVPLGARFPSGHRLPGCHPGCLCSVEPKVRNIA